MSWSTSMKVVYCVKYGSHEDLEVQEIEAPGAPGPGQVKIDIKARGIAQWIISSSLTDRLTA